MKAVTITTGILAHVDAGKTTLAEALLYKTGVIRSAGRVDHRNAHLDTYSLEKERGITIFSKQAHFPLGEYEVTLLDTPGHVDFSAEMERTLQVLDYALLVISGADGVQSHSLTLWRLLERYNVPVFLFINKMDQPGTDREALLRELKERLDANCTAFCNDLSGKDPETELFLEELATGDERVLDRYLAGEKITFEDVRDMIRKRKIFPCYFGSALKMEGVETLLEGMRLFMEPSVYPDTFRARVFRIARDKNTRLTYLKVTGGILKARQLLDEEHDEKADQLRIYNGSSYEQPGSAPAGTVLAVTGLTHTKAGDVLGEAPTETVRPILEPVITCSIILPEGTDRHTAYQKLRLLEEEIPEIRLKAPENKEDLQVQIMGEVQIQVLQSLILERTGMDVAFEEGHIIYRETIGGIAEGVGHFEPLRHYAEVHLILEPAAPGSGITFTSDCPTDELDLNWQRLIGTHVMERQHPGVLTGSDLTDVRITLTAGKAHLKHTEGGDFRQAVYRAVRQGLMQAPGILLEPFYSYRIELPAANLGRALSDLQKMEGRTDPPLIQGATAVLTGEAPVVSMNGYPLVLQSYTGGTGRIFLTYSGYYPCHNAQEVIEAAGYDPDQDTDNPAGSVFCSHGAGFYVPWDQVPEHMHLAATLGPYLKRRHDRQVKEQKMRSLTGVPERS